MVMLGAFNRGAFHLQGDVLNIKVLVDCSMEVTHKQLDAPPIFGVHNHVCGEGVVVGGNGSSMNVVNQGYTFQVFNPGLQFCCRAGTNPIRPG